MSTKFTAWCADCDEWSLAMTTAEAVHWLGMHRDSAARLMDHGYYTRRVAALLDEANAVLEGSQ